MSETLKPHEVALRSIRSKVVADNQFRDMSGNHRTKLDILYHWANDKPSSTRSEFSLEPEELLILLTQIEPVRNILFEKGKNITEYSDPDVFEGSETIARNRFWHTSDITGLIYADNNLLIPNLEGVDAVKFAAFPTIEDIAVDFELFSNDTFEMFMYLPEGGSNIYHTSRKPLVEMTREEFEITKYILDSSITELKAL